jgi:hypothetical protein
MLHAKAMRVYWPTVTLGLSQPARGELTLEIGSTGDVLYIRLNLRMFGFYKCNNWHIAHQTRRNAGRQHGGQWSCL